jgi:hypothetical protein
MTGKLKRESIILMRLPQSLIDIFFICLNF